MRRSSYTCCTYTVGVMCVVWGALLASGVLMCKSHYNALEASSRTGRMSRAPPFRPLVEALTLTVKCELCSGFLIGSCKVPLMRNHIQDHARKPVRQKLHLDAVGADFDVAKLIRKYRRKQDSKRLISQKKQTRAEEKEAVRRRDRLMMASRRAIGKAIRRSCPKTSELQKTRTFSPSSSTSSPLASSASYSGTLQDHLSSVADLAESKRFARLLGESPDVVARRLGGSPDLNHAGPPVTALRGKSLFDVAALQTGAAELRLKSFTPTRGAYRLDFHGSYSSVVSLPRLSLPEVCFLGRSNAGKSSLLNCLSRNLCVTHRDLAIVSKMPGRTRRVNVFLLSKAAAAAGNSRSGRTQAGTSGKPQCALTDLPGYGTALGITKIEKLKIDTLVGNYLRTRSELRLFVFLMDLTRDYYTDANTQVDAKVLQQLQRSDVPWVLVGTKADRIGDKGKQAAAIRRLQLWAAGVRLEETMASDVVGTKGGNAGAATTNLRPLLFSSKTGLGAHKLWQMIRSACGGDLDSSAVACDEENEAPEETTTSSPSQPHFYVAPGMLQGDPLNDPLHAEMAELVSQMIGESNTR
eukprot:GHVT01044458.1.p1 GENE.GHVT01044458.1~~GHVT01044458.1.p1  ORF type:complete len:581 (-),score=54.76 GHVT01044458.1:3924-5666(-)